MSQSLFELSHRNFKKLFEENKDTPWSEWLDIDLKSSQDFTPGKQGFTGILSSKVNQKVSCVYKISKSDDNLIDHEYKILRALDTIASYSPHFHKCYGLIPFESNVHYISHPLQPKKHHKCLQRYMLLMQYIPTKINLCDLLNDDKIRDDQIITVIKQVIISIAMGQKFNFTHYDLHSQNILIRNCNPNTYTLYLFENKTFLLPTFGNIANIIDFGFSYCGNVDDNSLTCTLVHTKVGFTSSRFDPFADIKLFLISLVDDLHRTERKKLHKKMHNIVRNIFVGMNVQWDSGWDNSKQSDPVKIVHDMIGEYVKTSTLLSSDNIWFDTIQTLIELPLSKLPYDDLETAVKSFVQEFIKFEERIASKTLLNYVLKILVKHVKSYRHFYLKGGQESKWAVIEIKKLFLQEYSSIIKYHNPLIDYNQLICSLLLMVQCIEGLFYDILEKRYHEKDKQNQIIRLKSIHDFFNVIDINFPIQEVKPFSTKTSIYVIDHQQEKNAHFYLKSENIKVINELKKYSDIEKYIKNVYLSL